jgi:hypothetical protein
MLRDCATLCALPIAEITARYEYAQAMLLIGKTALARRPYPGSLRLSYAWGAALHGDRAPRSSRVSCIPWYGPKVG